MSEIVQWFEHSLTLPFFEIGMKLIFSSPVVTAEFSKFAGILSAALSQHHPLGFEIAGISSPPPALFTVTFVTTLKFLHSQCLPLEILR